MNSTRLATRLGIGLLALAGIIVAVQFRRLQALRAETLRANATVAQAQAQFSVAAPHEAPKVTPLTEDEKLELLRLRSEVARLRQASTKSPTRSSSGSGRSGGTGPIPQTDPSTGIPFPEGFRPVALAQFAGFATPQDTLESFFWAIRRRDSNVIFQALTAESGQMITTAATHGETENPLEQIARLVPGYRIRSTKTESDNHAELEVQIDPRSPSQSEKMVFDRVEGVWKLRLQ